MAIVFGSLQLETTIPEDLVKQGSSTPRLAQKNDRSPLEFEMIRVSMVFHIDSDNGCNASISSTVARGSRRIDFKLKR